MLRYTFETTVLPNLREIDEQSKDPGQMKVANGFTVEKDTTSLLYRGVSRYFSGDSRFKTLECLNTSLMILSDILESYRGSAYLSQHINHLHEGDHKRIKQGHWVLRTVMKFEKSVGDGLDNMVSKTSYATDQKFKNAVDKTKEKWSELVKDAMDLEKKFTRVLDKVPVKSLYDCQHSDEKKQDK